MRREFVIQIHSGYGPTHYDLMIADGEALAAWQLTTSPEELPVGAELPAHRLPDHRRAYLTYEGPVSRNRGRVDILDAGECDLLVQSSHRWEFRMNGRKLNGCYELDAANGNDWTLTRLE